MQDKKETQANRQHKPEGAPACTPQMTVQIQPYGSGWEIPVIRFGITRYFRTDELGRGLWKWVASNLWEQETGLPFMEYRICLNQEQFSLSGDIQAVTDAVQQTFQDSKWWRDDFWGNSESYLIHPEVTPDLELKRQAILKATMADDDLRYYLSKVAQFDDKAITELYYCYPNQLPYAIACCLISSRAGMGFYAQYFPELYPELVRTRSDFHRLMALNPATVFSLLDAVRLQ